MIQLWTAKLNSSKQLKPKVTKLTPSASPSNANHNNINNINNINKLHINTNNNTDKDNNIDKNYLNEQFFDGWDADVIIHSEKTAILWNGIWHYKQILKTQSLKQVQTRDRIKTSIIEKYGYVPYVIKDMGKYNKAFVEQEFEIFKFMRINI